MKKQYNIIEGNKNFASDMQMCEHWNSELLRS